MGVEVSTQPGGVSARLALVAHQDEFRRHFQLKADFKPFDHMKVLKMPSGEMLRPTTPPGGRQGGPASVDTLALGSWDGRVLGGG